MADVHIQFSEVGATKVLVAVDKLALQTKKTASAIGILQKRLNALDARGAKGVQEQFKKTTTATQALQAQVTKLGVANTNLQSQMKKIQSGQTAVAASTKKAERGFRNLLPHVAAVTLSYMAMRRATQAVLGALKAGAEFEHQMAIVGGIARANAKDFEMLSAAARKAGETTVWTATESAQALRYLAMAGFNAAEATTALTSVLNLALIGELDLGRATDIATDTLRAFGLEAFKLTRIVDVFTATITRSNTNIEAMGQAMKYVAPVAKQFGYSVEETAAMIGILSQSGIKAGIAGRALRMSFLKSVQAADQLGISSIHLMDILKALRSQAPSMVEFATTLKDMFGIRSTPALMVLTENMGALEEFIEINKRATGETDAFIGRLNTVTVEFKKLASVVTDVAIEAFDKYSNALKKALSETREWIAAHKEDIIGLGVQIKDTFEPIIRIFELYAAVDKLTIALAQMQTEIRETLTPTYVKDNVIVSFIKEFTSEWETAYYTVEGLPIFPKITYFLRGLSNILIEATEKVKAFTNTTNEVSTFATVAELNNLSNEWKAINHEITLNIEEMERWEIAQAALLRQRQTSAYERIPFWIAAEEEYQESAAVKKIKAVSEFMSAYEAKHKDMLDSFRAADEEYGRDKAKKWLQLVETIFTKEYDVRMKITKKTHADLLKEAKAYYAELGGITGYGDWMGIDEPMMDETIGFIKEMEDGRKKAAKDESENDKLRKNSIEQQLRMTEEMYDDMKKLRKRDFAYEASSIKKQGKLYKEAGFTRIKVQEWVYYKLRELQKEQLLEQGGFVGGMFFYFLQMQDDWRNVVKQIGQFGYDTFKSLGDAFEKSVVLTIKGDLRGLSDLWRSFLDDLLDDFIRLIANLIKQWVMSGIAELIGAAFNIKGSQSTTSAVGGIISALGGQQKSGGSDYLGMGANALSTGYQLYAKESLLQTVYNWVGKATGLWGAGAGEFALGASAYATMPASYGMPLGSAYGTYGYTAPWLVELGGGAAPPLAGGGAAAGGLSAGTSALIGGLVAAAATAALMVLFHNVHAGGPTRLWSEWDVGESKRKSDLFDITDIANIRAEPGYWSPEDAEAVLVLQAKTMIGPALDAYNNIYKNVSKKSQKELRYIVDTAKEFKDLTIVSRHTADKGQRFEFMAQWGKEWKNWQQYQEFDYGVPTSILEAGTWTGRREGTGWTGSANQALVKAIGEYFAPYIAEATSGALQHKMFEFMTKEVQESIISSADPNMFLTNIDAWVKAFSENIANMDKAAAIWQNLLVFVGDANAEIEASSSLISQEAQLYQAAQAQATGYIQKIEELTGVQMEEEERLKVLTDTFAKLTEALTPAELNRTVKVLSLLDAIAYEINGAFDAYREQLIALGIDIEKLTDLEEKRIEKIKEEQQALIDLVNTGIDRTIDSLYGFGSALTDEIHTIIGAFIGIYQDLEAALGIKDYTNDIKKLKEELGELEKAYTDNIEQLELLVTQLSEGNVAGAVAYFSEQLKELQLIASQGIDYEKWESDFRAVSRGIKDQLGAFESTWLGGMVGEVAINTMELADVSKAAQAMQDAFADLNAALTSGTPVEDLAQFVDAVIASKESYSEAVQALLAKLEDSPLIYEETVFMRYLKNLEFFFSGIDLIMADLTKEMDTEAAAEAARAQMDILNEFFSALVSGDSVAIEKAMALLNDELIALIESGGGSASEIERLKAMIEELEKATAKYIAMEEQELAILKYKLGLGPRAESLQMTEIAERYGMDPQSIIDMFAGASLEDLKALAESLGINWRDIASDVAFLIDVMEDMQAQINKLHDAWQSLHDSMTGVDRRLIDIIERYGKTGMSMADIQKGMDFFLSMSEEAFFKWARSMNLTDDEVLLLIDDIGYLNNVLKEWKDTVKKITDMLSAVSDTFGRGITSSMLMSQIRGLQRTEPMTSDILLSMSEKLVQWYNVAVSEAQETANLWVQVADRTKSLIESIDSTIKNIKYSDLNVLLPQQKAEEAQQDYDKLFAAALTGGPEDVQKYLAFASTYLQQQQAEYKSSAAYQAIYAEVMANMETIRSKAEAGGYQQLILNELKSISNSLDLSGIQATFSAMENWILGALEKAEHREILLMIKTIYDPTSDIPTWPDLKILLEASGVATDVIKKIQGQYSGDMTWTELEDMLAATGLPEAVIRYIKATIIGEVPVAIEGVDELHRLNVIQTNTADLIHVVGTWGARIEKAAYSGGGGTPPPLPPDPGVYQWGAGTKIASEYAAAFSYIEPGQRYNWLKGYIEKIGDALRYTDTAINKSYTMSTWSNLYDLTKDIPGLLELWTGQYGAPYTYAQGGISWEPEFALVGENGPEAHIPLMNGSVPVQFLNGGSNQAGARDKEIALLKEEVGLLRILVAQNGRPIELGGKVLDNYSRARADEVRLAANATKNSENKVLFRDN